MASRPGDTEENALAWGLIIIFISLAGSAATGMPPVQFLIYGTAVCLAGLVLIGFTLAAIVLSVQLFLVAKMDYDKPIKDVILEELHWQKLVQLYKELVSKLFNAIKNELKSAGPIYGTIKIFFKISNILVKITKKTTKEKEQLHVEKKEMADKEKDEKPQLSKKELKELKKKKKQLRKKLKFNKKTDLEDVLDAAAEYDLMDKLEKDEGV
jgi:hypothetical protein